jgi:hypothetical protein
LLKTAKTEYAIKLAHDLIMHYLMLEADAIHEREAALHDVAIRYEDRDDYDAFEAEKHVQEVVHIYADVVMENLKGKERRRRMK